MNAPARITVPREAFTSPHAAAITMHCPNQDEWQMANRIGIAELRDQASVGVQRAESDAAIAVLQAIAREASVAVYAPLPASKLIMIRSSLALLMEGARGLERMHRDG